MNNIDTIYGRQVRLLVRLLPIIDTEKCFALKGGTAINLFYRDLPRLSVDIDLLYLPMENREEALNNIKAALSRISGRIRSTLKGSTVVNTTEHQENSLCLLVESDSVRVKIELSPVIRGCVFPPVRMTIREEVENLFGYAEIQVASFPDLYAGKICAALDRQHPRDLFDVKFLLENEGLTEDLRKTFLVFLISHHRPINELLAPNLKDIRGIYESEFASMARTEVPIEELEAVRKNLISIIHESLTPQERQFLLSFKNKQPDWALLSITNAADVAQLPSVRWKMVNLQKLSDAKHLALYEKLKSILYLDDPINQG
jgi:predicted nucleotidyltransferase component of viral defense system